MNAEKYGLERIYFGGCFIRGKPISVPDTPQKANRTILRDFVSHPYSEFEYRTTLRDTGHAATIATLSYAIRFWSKGTKRALFLRHEGFLYVFTSHCFIGIKLLNHSFH